MATVRELRQLITTRYRNSGFAQHRRQVNESVRQAQRSANSTFRALQAGRTLTNEQTVAARRASEQMRSFANLSERFRSEMMSSSGFFSQMLAGGESVLLQSEEQIAAHREGAAMLERQANRTEQINQSSRQLQEMNRRITSAYRVQTQTLNQQRFALSVMPNLTARLGSQVRDVQQGFVDLRDQGLGRFRDDFVNFVGDPQFRDRFRQLVQLPQQEFQDVVRSTMDQSLAAGGKQFSTAFLEQLQDDPRIQQFARQRAEQIQGAFQAAQQGKVARGGLGAQELQNLQQFQAEFEQFSQLNEEARRNLLGRFDDVQRFSSQAADAQGRFQQNLVQNQEAMRELTNLSQRNRQAAVESMIRINDASRQAVQGQFENMGLLQQRFGRFRVAMREIGAGLSNTFGALSQRVQELTFKTFGLFIAAMNFRIVVSIMSSLAKEALKIRQNYAKVEAVFRDSSGAAKDLARDISNVQNIANATALKMVGNFGAAFRSIGVTSERELTDLTERARQLAENLSGTFDLTFTKSSKLATEVIKGNIDQIKNLGVPLTDDLLDRMARFRGAASFDDLGKLEKARLLFGEINDQLREINDGEIPDPSNFVLALQSIRGSLAAIKDAFAQAFDTAVFRVAMELFGGILNIVREIISLPGFRQLTGAVIALTSALGGLFLAVQAGKFGWMAYQFVVSDVAGAVGSFIARMKRLSAIMPRASRAVGIVSEEFRRSSAAIDIMSQRTGAVRTQLRRMRRVVAIRAVPALRAMRGVVSRTIPAIRAMGAAWLATNRDIVPFVRFLRRQFISVLISSSIIIQARLVPALKAWSIVIRTSIIPSIRRLIQSRFIGFVVGASIATLRWASLLGGRLVAAASRALLVSRLGTVVMSVGRAFAAAGALISRFTGIIGLVAIAATLIITNWDKVRTFFTNTLPGALTSFLDTIKSWGQSVRDFFLAPFRAIGDEIQNIMEWIAGFFPQSPAKRGPFRNLRKMGQGIFEQMSQGMREGRGQIREALNRDLAGVNADLRGASRQVIIDRRLMADVQAAHQGREVIRTVRDRGGPTAAPVVTPPAAPAPEVNVATPPAPERPQRQSQDRRSVQVTPEINFNVEVNVGRNVDRQTARAIGEEAGKSVRSEYRRFRPHVVQDIEQAIDNALSERAPNEDRSSKHT